MTDWSGALARAFQQHLETTGSAGSGGSAANHRRLNQSTSISSPQGTTATTANSAVVLGGPHPLPRREQSFTDTDTSGTTGTTESNDVHAAESAGFEERAAIMEEGSGVLRSWAESFARLDTASRPPEFNEGVWRQLIDDGGKFLDRWANEAARSGWTALDVFGVHPAAPSTTYPMGLVPLIRGGHVVAVGTERATIRTAQGTLLTYLRRPRPAAVAVWTLIRDSAEETHNV